MRRVLVVDDEAAIAESIAYSLGHEGFEVATAGDGPSALKAVQASEPDLVVLDLMLPGLDGLEVCRQIRRERNTPILMLSAKGGELDRVVGLELGADDYMCKPFSMPELVARVKAILRRVAAAPREAQVGGIVSVGELTLNTLTRELAVRGTAVELSPKEYQLLRAFMSNPGHTLSRDTLLDSVWGWDFHGDARTVDVHVRWLREKIEANPGEPRYLTTVRGAGYRLNAVSEVVR